MKKIWKLLLIILMMNVVNTVKAQFNLVPNSSFEQYSTCPFAVGQIQKAIAWTNPNNSSPDYFNSCSSNPYVMVPSNYTGYEPAHTGNGYALVITYINYPPPFQYANNYREYLGAQLTDSLITGVNYCIRFYVSAADSLMYVSNNIGIYFSPIQIQDSSAGVLPYIPQFENPATNNLNSRIGWTLVSGTYTATGGEKFIVLGNFRDSSATVATSTGWTTNPGAIYAAYYIDDVLVAPCDSLTGIENVHFNPSIYVYPDPFQNYFIIESNEQTIKEINVYDVAGRIIYEDKFINQRKIEINLSNQSSGFYYLKIITSNSSFNIKLIKR